MTTLNYYLSKKNIMEGNKKTETYKRFIFYTILLIVISLSTINNSLASEVLLDLPTRVSRVNYIFEGTVIYNQVYSKNKSIYTSNTVQITKILKGELKCGTVEIITRGGTIDGKTVLVSHGLTLNKGNMGVFLCNEIDYPISDEDINRENNHQKSLLCRTFIRYKNNKEFIMFDRNMKYNAISLLHKELEKLTKLKFKKCIEDDIGLNNKEIEPQNKEEEILEIFPNYSKEDFNRLIEYAEYKRGNYTKNVERSGSKIYYDIINVAITGSTTKYLEFDITVKDNLGTKYLDQSVIRLRYSNAMFGDNFVANSKINATFSGKAKKHCIYN